MEVRRRLRARHILLAVALGGLPWGSLFPAQVRFELRGEGAPAGQAIQASLNQTVKVGAHIVNPAPAATIQGFSMAISHDPAYLDYQTATWQGTALDTPALAGGTQPGPDFFQAREVTGAQPGFTLGCIFEIQAATFFLTAGEFKVLDITYRAIQMTPQATPSRLAFAPQLDTPPKFNLYDDVDPLPDVAPQALTGVDVRIGSEPSYTIAFRDPTVTVQSGNEFTVPVLVSNAPQAVHGFSFGVRHDGAILDLLEVTLAEGILSVVPTPDQRFLSIQRNPAGGTGFTAALILSPQDASKVLDPARSPHHVVNARYRAKGGSGTSQLRIAGDLGNPRVEIILDLSGVTQLPLPPATNPPPVTMQVQVQGSAGSANFIRSDVDQNNRSSISDAIGVLNFLFQGESLIPPFTITRDQCPVAFDVDDNDQYTVGDAIHLLNYLFTGGQPPPAPFGRTCGPFTGTPTTQVFCNAFACP